MEFAFRWTTERKTDGHGQPQGNDAERRERCNMHTVCKTRQEIADGQQEQEVGGFNGHLNTNAMRAHSRTLGDHDTDVTGVMM